VIFLEGNIAKGVLGNMANLDVKHINNSIVFKYDFDSLDEFLKELITKEINKKIFPRKESINGSVNFTGTNSFEEAWNLCKFTYDDGYKRFSDLVKRVQFNYENHERVRHIYRPAGSSANISRFLCGIPDNMHSKQFFYDKPVINIYFNYAYNCHVTEKQIRNRGILTLALINYLENVKKFNVNFNFISIVKECNEVIYIKVKLKNKDEKLKIKKCYFPIVHPSFLRRLTFRAMEIIPYLQNDWDPGYGRALTYEESKKYIEEDNIERTIYISTPDELGIEGRNIEEDAKKFIEMINSKYNFLNEYEEEKRNDRRRTKTNR